jgi:hypothetical protein
VDARAIAELRAIAAEAREGVDDVVAGNDLAGEDRYRTLQCRAAALNAEYEWASPEEFETLFPTPAARRVHVATRLRRPAPHAGFRSLKR